MPSIPVDVLHHILEHADKATLTKICLLNKVCCSCSQDILYRDIRVDDIDFNICQTLNESTHLAKRVRSFEMDFCDVAILFLDEQELREIQQSLQKMTCLRSLRLDNPDFSILDGCTFKLHSFSSNSDYSDALRQFLCSQPSLTDVKLVRFGENHVACLGPCLPRLTRITTHFSWLPHIIPNRPVNQVISWGSRSHNEFVDLSFFTLSTAPIQKLMIDYTYLHSTPLQLLASIFPSLTHLTLRYTPEYGQYSMDFTEWSEWIENLLATLVTLRVFGTVSLYGVPAGGRLPFITQVSNRAPKLEYFSMYYGRGHYKKLVHGEWVLCDKAIFPPVDAFGFGM
jgi:hypothetical protein